MDAVRKSSWRRLLYGSRARKAAWLSLTVLLVSGGIWWAEAQQELPRIENRFTMGRVRFSTGFSGFGRGRRGGGGAPWAHDWPDSEENFMKILAEVTKIDVNPGGHIIGFDTEDCFKYPIAYLCEVGFLNLSPQEAHNMREYLLRGGFLIVDDFRGPNDLNNFLYQMRLVFPERSFEEMQRTHPIFTCFYDISSLDIDPPYGGYPPQYLGMSDDSGRLMMIVDYNNDISEYWEFSASPYRYPIADTNEAFKYGVNYVMYALTH